MIPVRTHDEILDAALFRHSSRDTTDPHWLVLQELTFDERRALPAGFHRPVWYAIATPKSWICAVCWDDGTTYAWPCAVAAEHGHDVAVAIGADHVC